VGIAAERFALVVKELTIAGVRRIREKNIPPLSAWVCRSNPRCTGKLRILWATVGSF